MHDNVSDANGDDTNNNTPQRQAQLGAYSGHITLTCVDMVADGAPIRPRMLLVSERGCVR